MALINNSKKFIFIGNARCASTSMYHQIGKLSDGDDIIWPNGIYAKPDFYHMGIEEVLKEFPEKKDYFKFGFVRNPWSRILSAWNEFQDKGHGEWNGAIYNYKTFIDFCLDFNNCPLSRDIHFHPNYNQVTIDDEIAIDFVGRFENLMYDFQKATKDFGFETELSIHRRKTDTKNYRQYYTDETRDIIGEFYKKDIETFGYEF